MLVEFIDLNKVDFLKAWKFQEELFNETINKKIKNRELSQSEKFSIFNYILLCEHHHTYTIGKSGDNSNLLLSSEKLKEINATFYKINRGGDITYHGPGQLVGYPILDLESFNISLKRYVFLLEEVLIKTLNEFDIIGERVDGAPGIWIGKGTSNERKICALGIKSSRSVTMHGFSMNINNDLKYFDYINPCGFTKPVTSVSKELGIDVDLNEIKNILLEKFSEVFKTEISKNKYRQL